ncbi:LOW QUALITY PROTEIN: Endo-1,3(4)-beta-glucanase 1 [Phytophthora palmivora]|uniref:Endo-1,3(4)-beta-glucanase 1 n=1 Tax=Phytophthora palmivora TaxID=4796 RepID=A0A2P4YEE4_9STRA|nr:LOW QUALITY PROTEIN: Endo-1,3(4)-beta-glucanase 1 [Phytophthora palmivora]
MASLALHPQLQTCYSYTYREITPEINDTVKFYSHSCHSDLTLTSEEFYPNVRSGTKVRVAHLQMHGLTLVSGKCDGLTPRIDTEHNITFVDDSVPGKFVILLNKSQTWQQMSFILGEGIGGFSVNVSGSSLVAVRGYSSTIRVALPSEDPAVKGVIEKLVLEANESFGELQTLDLSRNILTDTDAFAFADLVDDPVAVDFTGIMKIRVRFLLGNMCSFVSLVLLLAANSGHEWAHDAVNSVDIGLWYLTERHLESPDPLSDLNPQIQGIGVRYKLINAGAAVNNTDVISTQPFTLYSRFW